MIMHVYMYAYENSGLHELEGDGEGWDPPPEKFWNNMCRTVLYNLHLKDFFFFLKFW